MSRRSSWPHRAAIFGASGGVGAALCRVLASRADGGTVYAGSRSDLSEDLPGTIPFTFDLADEASLVASAEFMQRDGPLGLVVIATGSLTLSDGAGPEKSWRALDAGSMAEVFAINTIGPAMIAKHMIPLLPRDRRSVLAALSARVGSIEDNRLGGWHSYRASKAALNMVLKNLAIELARTHSEAVVAGLHPGTVDTALSKPFQRNVATGRLFTPDISARHLLNVIDRLAPSDSREIFAWDGQRIPF